MRAIDELSISVSKGEDAKALAERVTPLLQSEANGGKWQLTPTSDGLTRTFRFKTFKKTWGFMTAVAERCGEVRHHPEWSNVFTKTTITWTTHAPRGLSGKDVDMAEFCDETAREFGEVEEGESKGCGDFGKEVGAGAK
ncbi:hypothetical protein B0A48_03751 [Cryoendolithus antarcticus]|uniref:4a-hydroxytetrahydrobiopterin dehydratase n=1 Tax=Cryoendolithus antarcticus TaxID=1507870 RepID=A0A1V8TGP9_9PEZI|nr:hypothetical protein B0A48_03751 [Cryoendolithus antarcticus]